MGFFKDSADSKASFGTDYPKPGQYYVIVEMMKHGIHAMKKVEQAICEGRYLHIMDKALWTGDPKLVPTGEKGQHMLNLPGEEPKVIQPCNIVFQSGQKGAENRLKKFVCTAYDVPDEQFPKGAEGEAVYKQIFDPAAQTLKWVVLEIKSGEQTTQSNKKIVASTPQRRVWAEELRQMWEQGKLAPETIDYLTKEGRLTKMLQDELAEKSKRAAVLAGTK